MPLIKLVLLPEGPLENMVVQHNNSYFIFEIGSKVPNQDETVNSIEETWNSTLLRRIANANSVLKSRNPTILNIKETGPVIEVGFF
jgi:hypothetical protein